ncbi:MAG: hypothetical protein L3K26_20415 [Candidatus Hydrogenedentes bacterium]|nr:hypothetical protein [Candidatus Hydrogenedentota bacterium]
MDDNTDKKTPRKKPGTPLFMGAMAFYLLLVHGTSLLMTQAGTVQGPPLDCPDIWPWLTGTLNSLGGASALSCALVALPLLYGCMVCVFLLTRQIVGGPPWLGSLAGTFLMAHPAKTEILFTPTGLFYCLATLAALAATLAYVRLCTQGCVGRYMIALACFVCATVPFAVNAALFGVLILIEFMVGDPEKRNWLRLLPFVLVTMLANWFHLDTIYAQMPTLATMFGPLLLVVYPIGLLPETVASLGFAPWQAWGWGVLVFVCVVASLYYIKSKPYRFAVIAIILFRFYPGALPIDYVTMDGGGQLFYPLALTGVALAALSVAVAAMVSVNTI